jgi:hypothetical protein
MKNWLLLLLLGISFQAAAQGQRIVYHAYDIDTLNHEWTAMTLTNSGHLAITTLAPGSMVVPQTGNIRLRLYPYSCSGGQSIDPTGVPSTYHYTGKARVMSLSNASNLLILAGGYSDTTSLGMTMLPYAGDTLSLDPFLAAIDPDNGQVAWSWHRAAAQNNYIHKIRYHANGNQLIASGLSDDVSGWLAAFNAANGQLLWEKHFPGVRTLSDAHYDNRFPGSLLITGTISDNGFLNQHPTPVQPPATGYRTFLARYYPANDSAIFLETQAYITFDFSPSLVKTHPLESNFKWSTPMISNSASGMSQLQYYLGGPSNNYRDTVGHDQYWVEIENLGLGMYSRGNEIFYKQPGFNPNLFSLQSPEFGFRSSFSFNHTIIPEVLGVSVGACMNLAFKTPGSVTIQNISSPIADTILPFPGVSSAAPRWVLLSTGYTLSTAEMQQPSFVIYPNPVTNGLFNVRLLEPMAGSHYWTLRDLQGRVTLKGQLDDSNNSIPCAGLSPGMYLFEIATSKGQAVQKLLLR